MELLFKEEVFAIIGCCIEVWRILGFGFSEIIYKDAMEIEFAENQLPYLRENELCVRYKEKILRRKFKSDFTVFDKIIVEVKSGVDGINSEVISQTLNYFKVSGYQVGLIVNFGKRKMEYKRLVM